MQRQIQCPSCDYLNLPDARFCSGCSRALPFKTCPRCAAIVNRIQARCPGCGETFLLRPAEAAAGRRSPGRASGAATDDASFATIDVGPEFELLERDACASARRDSPRRDAGTRPAAVSPRRWCPRAALVAAAAGAIGLTLYLLGHEPDDRDLATVVAGQRAAAVAAATPDGQVQVAAAVAPPADAMHRPVTAAPTTPAAAALPTGRSTAPAAALVGEATPAATAPPAALAATDRSVPAEFRSRAHEGPASLRTSGRTVEAHHARHAVPPGERRFASPTRPAVQDRLADLPPKRGPLPTTKPTASGAAHSEAALALVSTRRAAPSRRRCSDAVDALGLC